VLTQLLKYSSYFDTQCQLLVMLIPWHAYSCKSSYCVRMAA